MILSPVPNLLSCCHLGRQALDAFFGFGDSRLKSQTKNDLNWGADKAAPSILPPGLESQAHHLRFYQFKFEL